MTSFRTPIPIHESGFDLTYKKKSTLIGSCFTDNVGNMLHYYKFPARINPFGVMYNPISVAKVLDTLIHKNYFTEKNLHQHSHTWLSFYHDTAFSGEDKEQVLKAINKNIEEASQWLANTNLLIITFGTARVYHHKEKQMIVSNCHKIPSKEFDRYLLNIEDITEQWRKLLGKLRQFNPNAHIVFTISPVRHWKDGAAGNQQSKATLILALKQLLDEYKDIEYFPAYEIMMDELRDYRFYADDMLHPGTLGIQYIWEQFARKYIKKSTFKMMNRVEEIVKARSHKPFRPRSLEYQDFLKKQIEKTEQLLDKYPYIDLRPELDYFIAQLEGTGEE